MRLSVASLRMTPFLGWIGRLEAAATAGPSTALRSLSQNDLLELDFGQSSQEQKQRQREGTRNRNDKSEMRGSLHFGGKCAAFGRDDASWVGLKPLDKNNDGNNNENKRDSNEANATAAKQTEQQRDKGDNNETKATATKQTRQQRDKRNSYETNATATRQTQQQPSFMVRL